MNSDDDLLARLPAHDVGARASQQIRQRAHAILAERARHQRPRAAFGLSAYYHRFVEPLALIALAFSYLALTMQDTLALFN